MNFQECFNNGLKHFKKGEFLQAIENFEECLNIDPNDFLVYYYLGLSHIYRKNFETGFKYIINAYNLNKNDVNIINALAFLNLKENNFQEAINYWLEALDIEPKNIFIKKNLEKIRKAKDIKKLAETATPEEFIGIKIKIRKNIKLPEIKKEYLKYAPLLLLPIILFIFFVKILTHQKPTSNNLTQTKYENIKQISSINEIELPDNESDFLQTDVEKALFRYSKADVKYLFNQCKRYIKNKYYNTAIITINKIMHSNLSYIVKQKFNLLKIFIADPKEFELKDNIYYKEIMNLPAIYENVYILWEGKIDDLILEENQTTFKFIVKEDSNTVGIAEVYFENVLPSLKNNDKIKLLGKFERIKEGTRYPIIKGISLLKENK